jgi:hypothetical protein
MSRYAAWLRVVPQFRKKVFKKYPQKLRCSFVDREASLMDSETALAYLR